MAISVPNRDAMANYPFQIGEELIRVATEANTELSALGAATNALDTKHSVKLATTGALAANTRTGNVLTANANGALGNIDGVATALNDRILVKDEATQANNGPYYVSAIGDGSNPWTLTRTTDADESAEVTPNMLVMVEQGTANGDKVFYLDVNGPVTLNTTALVFADFRGLAITAPVDVDTAAAAVGVSLTVARADHKHDVVTAAPASIGTANAEGVALGLARADHVHDHGAQTTPTHHAVATTLANGFLSSTDKTKLDSIQTGTGTLVAGTVTVAANITANSRVSVAMTDPGAGAITGFAALKITSKVIGAPGSFDVTAIDDAKATIVTAECVFDWIVVN